MLGRPASPRNPSALPEQPAPPADLLRTIEANCHIRGSDFLGTAEAGHKEWLHFAVSTDGLELLINLSEVDDVRPQARAGSSIARLTWLAHIDETGFHGGIEDFGVLPPGVSARMPGRRGLRMGPNAAGFERGVFRVHARSRDGALTVDLTLTPEVMPAQANNLTVHDCPPIHWLVVPRLRADGHCRLHGRDYSFRGAPAYHDHNWGSFRWGRDFAWEWGYGTPSQAQPARSEQPASAPWTLVFVRLTDRGRFTDLMQAVFVWHGAHLRRLFRADELRVEHHGFLRCPRPFKLAPAMGLISEGSATDVPRRLSVTAAGRGDRLHFDFDTRDVGQVIIPNDHDLGVTIINEVCGDLRVEGRVGGESVRFACRSIFEFLGK